MIIECPNCQSKYQYDEERFEGKPSKKIKCARCQHIFNIHNPVFVTHKSPAVQPPSGRTFAGRTETARVAEATEQSPIPQARAGSEALQLPAGKRLSLAILDGPDAGTVFRITQPRITIGRFGADLTVNDSEASRQHAVIEIRESGCTLADLGSTNGTLLGGEKISGPVELTDKSEFQIGATTLMLIVTEDQ